MQDTALQTDESRRLRWWDLVLPVLGGVIVFAVITFGVAIWAMAKGDGSFIPKFAARMQSADQAYVLNMAMVGLLYISPVIVMFWIARRKRLEFFRPVPLYTIAWASGGGLLYTIAFQAVQNFLISHAIVSYAPSPAELLLVPRTFPQLVLGLGLAAIFGPFVEEFYFRGFLLSWCRGKMALVWATLINAALFGIVHFYFLQHVGLEGIFITAVIGLLGALNVWWTVRTGSLWAAFANHAAYNGASLIGAFFFPGNF